MMKKATTLALLFGLAAGGAYAAPHGFQQQIGASELDPSIWDGGKITVNAPTAPDFTPAQRQKRTITEKKLNWPRRSRSCGYQAGDLSCRADPACRCSRRRPWRSAAPSVRY